MATVESLDLFGGFKIPVVGFGTFTVTDEKVLEKALDAALEAGYRHIDTAHYYQNEHVIGNVLKKWIASGKLKREDVFITTKLPAEGVQPDRVEKYIKESLDNLKLEYVDLYLIHFPMSCKPRSPDDKEYKIVAEPTDHLAVWKKMEEQVEKGRTKTIGLSNFNERQIEKILNAAKIKPCCLQIENHVYLPQINLVKFCQQKGIVVVAYSPLGNPGMNTWLSSHGLEQKKLPDMLNDTTIKRIASKHRKTSAQIMLKYLLQRNIVVIPKSVTPSRIRENIDLFEFSLDDTDLRALAALEIGEEARVCGWSHFKEYYSHPEWPFPK